MPEDILDLRALADELDLLREDPDEDPDRLAALVDLEGQLGDLRSASDNDQTLIAESYFVEYARELAEDCGMIPADGQWPLYCIDWQWAANELRVDYSSVTFDGAEYWTRA